MIRNSCFVNSPTLSEQYQDDHWRSDRSSYLLVVVSSSLVIFRENSLVILLIFDSPNSLLHVHTHLAPGAPCSPF